MPGGGSVGRGELLWRHITAIYKFGIVDFGARSKEPSRVYTSEQVAPSSGGRGTFG